MKKILFLLLITLLIPVISCQKGGKDSPKGKKRGRKKGNKQIVRAVRIEHYKPKTNIEVKTYHTSVKSKQDIIILARASGEVVKLDFDIGKEIKKGEILGRIDPNQTLLNIEKVKLSLKELELNYNFQKKVFQRDKKLFNKKMIAKELYEKSEQTLKIMENSILLTKNSLKQAQLAYRYTLIKAPFDGKIVTKLIEQNQVVSLGTPIARVIDSENLIVTVGVSYQVLQQLKKYKDRFVQIISQNKKIDGKIIGFSEGSENLTGLYTIKIGFKNIDNMFLIGEPIDVEIAINAYKNTVELPRKILHFFGKYYTVFMVKDGVAHREKVDVIVDNRDKLIVSIPNLSKYDGKIVVLGHEGLEDKQKVKVLE